MRQTVIAQILAPVAQILRLRRAAVVDPILDPAADVVPVDRQHRLNVAVARGTNEYRLIVRHGLACRFGWPCGLNGLFIPRPPKVSGGVRAGCPISWYDPPNRHP